MNILQIQDRLKELPSSPDVMQLLASYANGANPEVPPYLAMSELLRRKKIMESASSAQPPEGTVKDKLTQTAGIAALQQMMQPPPQSNPAETGIAAAPTQAGPMNFAPGGIVSFANAGYADEDEDEDDEDSEEGYGDNVVTTDAQSFPVAPQRQVDSRPMTEGAPAPKQDTAQQMAELGGRIKAQEAVAPPIPESRLQTRRRLAQENPELYGVLNQPAGKEYLAGLRALQEKQAAEGARQRADIESGRRMDFFKSLMAAGEATRGQRGLGALLGGYGKSAIALDEQRAQQLANIQQQELKRQELMNTARFEVEKLQRAQAEGDVKGENEHKAKLADIAAKLGVSLNTLLGKQYAALAGIRERELGAEATKEAARLRAEATKEAARIRAAAIANRPERSTDFDNMKKAFLDAAVSNGADPRDPQVILAASKAAAYELGKQASTIGAEASRQERADREYDRRVNFSPEAGKIRALQRKDPAAAEAEKKRIRDEIMRDYGIEPRAPTAAPAPAPAGSPRRPPSPPPGFVPMPG